MELTESDTGTSRTVAVGDELVVTLPERPTTGFQWQPDVDGAALQLVDDRYEVPAQPPGAAGVHRFTFRVLRDGSTVLKLVERRTWEHNGGEEYRVDLRIER